MVSKEDIDDAYKHEALGQLSKLANRLLKERDAYRQVALNWKNTLDPIKLMDDKIVDEEAQKLLGDK
jgi:hypothetical protein